MNKQAILTIAEALEGEDNFLLTNIGLSMDAYIAISPSAYSDKSGHACGSTACIAGWAAILMESDGYPRSSALKNRREILKIDDVHSHARRALGLDEETAKRLFLPEGDEVEGEFSVYDATPAQAAKVLRHLAETGEIDWRKAAS